MTIRRFAKGTVYMDETPDGIWVRYADHATALAAMTERAERAERYVDGQNLRSDYRTATEIRAALERAEKDRDNLTASIISACTGSGCLNAHELRAALDRTHKRATNAEKENALLRAECEAWREFDAEAEERSWSKAWPVHADRIADAQNATDAAGALKGVE